MKFIDTEKAPAALGPYSQAVQVGELVFLSGQLGIDPDSHRLASGVEEQTLRALENLEHVLSSVGLAKTDVVKCTIFVKDMDDFAAVNRIYERFFEKHKPARACVEVARLPKDGLVEIDAIARSGG